MNTNRIAVAALFAAAVSSLSATPAAAQGCYYTRDWFPLVFPFGIAAAIVDTAATIVTLPLVALTSPPYVPVYPVYGTCSSPYYGYPPPPANGAPYTGYGYYGPPR